MKSKPTKRITRSTENDTFERCVLCGDLTDVEVWTPIELRKHYELGCGQLCPACYQKLMGGK